MKRKRIIGTIIYHILVTLGALVMIYPLLWMVFSSFKPTTTIFATASQLIPSEWTTANYINGWKGLQRYTFGTFFKNSFIIAMGATVGTLLSSSVVAYALQRLKFGLKKVIFMCVLSTMMLPAQILMIPQYLWFSNLGWVGTYYPMIYWIIFKLIITKSIINIFVFI